MKKLFLALAVIASVQVAGAQVKTASAAKKALEAAEAAAANPKKATKADTWVKLGKAYVDAYDAAQGPGAAALGMDKKSAELTLMGQKPSSSQQVEFGGQPFTKDSYSHSDYYYNANGALQMIVITKPVVKDALSKALDAYKKAQENDAKGAKKDDIANGFKSIYEKYASEAYSYYTMGELEKASLSFEAAASASAEKPYAKLDTSYVYNAGLTANMAGNNARAKELFEKCLSYNYFEGGEVFVRLASIAEGEGNQELQKKYLEDGFASYPQSQAILIGLINYYITNKQDTGRLFELIAEAKKNEPNNASLYYVEGNIYKELGKMDEAVAAYDQCASINPEYEYGYIGKGILYYNQAIDFQEAASEEMDDAKYMKLVDQFVASLKNCIEPFEKAFEVSKDEDLKVNICEYLKNACYRFREDDPAYQAKYDKYSNYGK